jgi:hypothetical protein
MAIDNEKYFGKDEPEVKTVTVVDDQIDWEAKELNKVAKYFDVTESEPTPVEVLPDPPAEISYEMEDVDSSKKNVSKAMQAVAMAGAMIGDNIPPYLRRRRIPRVPSARELQTEEAKQAALKAAEEKRQRKAAKRMKEFK